MIRNAALLITLLWLSLQSTVGGVNVSIPIAAPSTAPGISRSLLSFSIEQDRWPDWAGTSTRNEFYFNVLSNLQDLSGEATRIRIGADSEDHTNFNPSVQVSEDIFPAITATVPYPEATNITVGNGFYDLASMLPSGTEVIWGVNLRDFNVTAASLEAKAIAQAFASSAVKDAGVTLQAIEVGNEADLYRFSGFNVSGYVSEWTRLAKNVSATVSAVLGTSIPFQGAAFAESSHSTTGFSPQAIIADGILNSQPGSQITSISQHHYSGSFCSGSNGVLQDLMTKSTIRSNLTQFSPDISVVQSNNLSYVLGETNSYSCHGAPGVSNTAGAALWALDYTLTASQLGIERLYFHEGIGYKYNFVQPVTLNRSILDGSTLSKPLAPHIQSAYYAAVITAEAIGPSGSTQAVELTVNNSQVSGFGFFENGNLARAVFINLNAFTGDKARASVHVVPSFVGGQPGCSAPSTMSVKRLSIPFANGTSGVTWGGQTYETADGKVQGQLNVTTVPVTAGVDVHDTEAVLLSFS
ncbi:uncharacterized protein STEHIDRAFT_128057 [Stereum hirsutum FP-91666 SS1]|uniref:uncharacterized protein n=1 Tax=Stereum hirsutum (strain FP-91666) TaxID=721885 RepID=UPI000440AA34|nr:uncharacterized protein STEHIDRAFT_128057 [Stereum hirsutum FP-91666 SS1]EIM91055.1 hypothetical protein STEHIDRAFT_128057 [Stereum hirsutum FP-91666 SS1]